MPTAATMSDASDASSLGSHVLMTTGFKVSSAFLTAALGVTSNSSLTTPFPCGKSMANTLNFPHGNGVVKEELLVTPSAAVKKALDTLKPVVINTWEPSALATEASDIVAAVGIKAFCN